MMRMRVMVRTIMDDEGDYGGGGGGDDEGDNSNNNILMYHLNV